MIPGKEGVEGGTNLFNINIVEGPPSTVTLQVGDLIFSGDGRGQGCMWLKKSLSIYNWL